MNQRREARLQICQSVAITLFGEPDIHISGKIRNISGKGLGLELKAPVAPGTALKVEVEDALLLGEVIYCRRDEDSFYAGVELEHSLCGLGELSRMVSAFHDLAPPLESSAQQTHAVIDRNYESQKQPH